MAIFAFEEDQALGEVSRVETARVWVRVTSPHRLRVARVGRLVAVKGRDANEWVIGMIEKVWRRPAEPEELEELVEEEEAIEATVAEENGVQLVLVGTYRAREGVTKDYFTRAVLTLPTIDEFAYPIEEKALEDFMGIISREAEKTAETPLAVGCFTLDPKATAFLDGNKLFQRHAALVGSTGAGKSWAVASLTEQAAKLPHANVIVFDLHGEYKPLSFARQLRVAGPGDLKAPAEDVIFLPYWLLNYEEMQALLIDRSEQNAPNQAMILNDFVATAKRDVLERLDKSEVLESFTIDSPVPFSLAEVESKIDAKDKEMVPGKRDALIKGDFTGKLTRFLLRLRAKRSDRRYGFMYEVPQTAMEYEYLHELAEKLLGHGEEAGGLNPGIKVVDFSEVPSDVLPVMLGLVARLVSQIQFWTDPSPDEGERHPVLLVCDEAHLYMPSLAGDTNPLERRAVENFQRIAKEGRKYGVGLLVVSQRPSEISTTILSQCNNFIALRLTNREDQGIIRRLMPESLEGILEILPALEMGEAVIVGDAILLPTRVKLSEPAHKPLSGTIDFWERWMQEDVESDLVQAVENMRRQTRVAKAKGKAKPKAS